MNARLFSLVIGFFCVACSADGDEMFAPNELDMSVEVVDAAAPMDSERDAVDASAHEDAAAMDADVDAREADVESPTPEPEPAPSVDHVYVIPVDQNTPHWKDLAYLAATAASAKSNDGLPLVVALAYANQLGDSAQDFFDRLRPERVTVLGAPTLTLEGADVEHLPAPDLSATTVALARAWQRADRAVVVSPDNYGSALLAASLAGRVRAPLFFVDGRLADDVAGALQRLSPDEVLHVGEVPAVNIGDPVRLPDADAVIAWLSEEGLPIDYLAVVNPNDRSAGRSQKLSLTASLYTTRREGLVLPISTPVPADPAEGTALATALSHLDDRYAQLGRHPEHLALVGSFDVIPIERRRSLFDVPESEWPVTDIPYGERDGDPFREIAVGRIYTDSLYRGSLLAGRTVAYEFLRDGNWDQRFIESGLWGFDELRAILLNVGFEPPEHPTEAEINARRSIEASAILHKDHSHCTVLGHAFDVNTEALYAPAVVLSRGCSVAGIDLVNLNTRTVPGKMLGRGAVAFVGAPRNSIAGNTVTEVAFFNYLLEGQTLGQAMRSAFNNATVHYLDENSDAGMRYVLDNEMLFGDPALRFHVPGDWLTRPARATRDGNEVTVTAPEAWTQVQFMPEQLDEWNYQGELFMYVGPGAEPKTYWSGQYDTEDLYYTVAIALPGDVPTASLTDLTPQPAPLGWHGAHYVDGHADGTKTVRWRVRLLDYSMTTGEVQRRLDEAHFELGD